ncbi:MAG: hypothetical protein J6B08_06820 [Ruminiclostridium sp.]|nr:hypothetical protein [Ruminiclostridium sp.]
MEDNPKTLPERKRNRMDGYDYSLCGAYFVTICLKNRECFLWKTVGADIIRPNNAYELSEYGRIVEEEIKRMDSIYDSVSVGDYIVMPDHIHLIIFISEDIRRGDLWSPENERNDTAEAGDHRSPLHLIKKPALSRIIQQFKGSVTKQIGFPIWQKSFHDHIIRNEQDYNAIRRYIYENPEKYLYNEHSS